MKVHLPKSAPGGRQIPRVASSPRTQSPRRHTNCAAAFYQRIVEDAPEGIWVLNAAGRTSYVNGRLADMLGYEAREMFDRPPGDFLNATTSHVADPPTDADPKGGAIRRESHFIHKTGRVVYALLSITHVEDASASAGRLMMVTELPPHERALRESAQRLKGIIDAEPACVKLVSAEGVLLDMNRAGLRMIEADTSDQVVGQNVIGLVHPDDREAFVACHKSASLGEPRSIEFRMIGLRGSQRWLETHAVRFQGPTADPAAPASVLSVTNDITERKHLEDQLRQAQKMEAVGRLAGGVAHDFNNLLTAILGYCDLATSGLEVNHPLWEDLQQIHQAGRRAAALTRQLLAFSRKQILSPRVIDLNDTVASLVKMIQRVIGEDVTISVHLEPALQRIRADRGQLEQVILNLAVNARDAMPEGGSLSITTANTQLTQSPVSKERSFTPGEYVTLTVVDTGIGMNEETKAHVFEPFFTTKESGRGTGLGLSTVYGIVKQSGGFVLVDSSPGQGAAFTIYLPATFDPLDRDLPVERSEARTDRAETVLIVEDEAAVRELARRVLQRKGYKVLVANGPKDALDLATEAEGRIDLLLSDVVMPHMSGLEMAARITTRWPSIRVMYMTGYMNQAAAPHAVGQHVSSALLRKPFSPDELAQAVRSALDFPGEPSAR
jgi:PAS domain S-box-containing protein